MGKQRTLIYFAYYGYERTVIDSQVLVPTGLLRQRGIQVRYVFMESPYNFISYLLKGAIYKRYQRLPMGSYHVLLRIPKNILNINSYLLGWVLKKCMDSQNINCIHARGVQGTSIVLSIRPALKDLRVVCDVRGLESAEYEYMATHRFRKKMSFFQKKWFGQLLQFETKAILGADDIFCISKSMINYLQSQLNDPNQNQKFHYIPCSVQNEKFRIESERRLTWRKNLNVENRLVMIYSGAMAQWQLPENVVELFIYMKRLDPSLFFRGITPGVEKLKSMFQAKNVNQKDYRIEESSFDNIHELLACGDIGILLREENPVNRYACPTKFAEYLAAGLHIVATAAIEDIREYIEQYRIGTVLTQCEDLNQEKDRLKRAIESSKDTFIRIERAKMVAKRNFDWTPRIPEMERAYFE